MVEKNALGQIRKEMEACIGKRIQLKTNKGRKKTLVKEGILESTYPSIFTVRFENDFKNVRKVSYSYTDVLTNTVEIKVCGSNKMIV
ncbi:MAG: Veg protein [Clostridiaceae bacterium]|nr:Veg protein [Clostridiaceae bacterium]